MKILYLTYGTQSGVVVKLSSELLQYGIESKYCNVTRSMNYRYEKFKFPRLSFINLINVYKARKEFGIKWKGWYLRTDFAYDRISSIAEKAIYENDDCAIVLQSGLLFSPQNTNNKPYVLGILDNTYLIGKFGRNRPVTELVLSESFLKKEKEAYHRANLILSMSNHVRDSLVEDYGVLSKKILVVGVGPNVEPDKNYVPNDYKYESKKVVMIAIDFIRKGGAEVLEAFKMLKIKIPKVKLIVIGEKMDYQVEGVSFLGRQNKSRIKKELSEANLFVMPSHAEPFGVAFIEAMAFSTPCIGSHVEAIPEIISNEETGFIVAPGDVEGLAKRMEIVLSDPSLSRKMGKAGYNKYLKKFCWSIVAKKISDQLNLLLSDCVTSAKYRKQ